MTITQRRTFSFIVSLAFLLCVMVTPFFTPSASAVSNSLDFRPFGAWIAAALSALNISVQSVTAPINQLTNYIADPFDVVYTYQEDQLNQYFDQSTIKITQNGTVIDGVVYDDIWISNDAASKFRTNGFDFATAYSISSNTNGTFASGAGSIAGLPAFNINNQVVTQPISIPAVPGSYPYGDSVITVSDSSPKNFTITFNGFTRSLYQGNVGCLVRWSSSSPSTSAYANWSQNGGSSWSGNWAFSNATTYDPFDFDFVAGNIPTPDPLPSNYGLTTRLPHTLVDEVISGLVGEYPDLVSDSGLVVDDSDYPDIFDALDELAELISTFADDLHAEFTPIIAPVVPVTIADTDYTILGDTLNTIDNSINSVGDTITSLGDTILEDIEVGPIRVFDKALDLISAIFAPVFAAVRSALGIWHHVTTWLSSISAPFTFVLNALSYTPVILYPVYAVVAGTLCISIYRRFGK